MHLVGILLNILKIALLFQIRHRHVVGIYVGQRYLSNLQLHISDVGTWLAALADITDILLLIIINLNINNKCNKLSGVRIIYYNYFTQTVKSIS